MSHAAETLERIAVAIERLAEDPVIHMESGPPNCPHCDRINPSVTVDESGGQGLLGEFVIRCKCDHCQQIFYALPIQWRCVSEISHIEQAQQEMRELSGNNGSE